MADSELIALTEDTTPDLTDYLYLVDSAGTVDKRTALSDIASTFAGTSAFTGAYAPKDLSAVFYTGAATLTDTTPNTTTYTQWGTEEAVIAQADAPASAVVVAFCNGQMHPRATGETVGHRGQAKMQVSFDGGGSFADMPTNVAPAILSNSNVDVAAVFAMSGRSTGTVTGSIQVRAMVRDVDTANDTTWGRGYITVMVHPQ